MQESYKGLQESQISQVCYNVEHFCKNFFLITFLQNLHLFVRNSYKNAVCNSDQKFVQDSLDSFCVFFLITSEINFAIFSENSQILQESCKS